ncbi:hypothetical protein MHYP_G00005630 [Metynnis hypsauchen]
MDRYEMTHVFRIKSRVRSFKTQNNEGEASVVTAWRCCLKRQPPSSQQMENNQPNHAFSEMRKLPDGEIANDSEAQESSVNSLVALFQPHRCLESEQMAAEIVV